jgi:hypothetical protein
MARSISSRSVPAARRFALESLENRELMAGDVTATVVGGNLFITGDNAANGLRIGQVAPNQFALIGLDQGGLRTTVQGAKFQIASGVTGSVFINMNGGNDAVEIEDNGVQLTPLQQATTPNNFQFPFFPQNVAVNMGAGADTFDSEGMRINGRLTLDTGFGNEVDTVKLVELKVDAVNTGGLGLDIDTQGGNDKVEIIDSGLKGLTDIDTGSEDDIVLINDVLIALGGKLTLRTQAGNDNVTLSDVNVDGDALIDTGLGNDFVDLFDVRADGQLEFNLGFGNDLLRFERVIAEVATFDGSFDTDALIDSGDNAIEQLLLKNFEIGV